MAKRVFGLVQRCLRLDLRLATLIGGRNDTATSGVVRVSEQSRRRRGLTEERPIFIVQHFEVREVQIAVGERVSGHVEERTSIMRLRGCK